ncbi:MAG: N-acetyl-gamma-glutamyl-phosphate reductase [Bacteroides sp.]|nr:N-acetyl-gamma-glutamyl-phosphate reductase [Eubacterium sp.]MCM1419343.1 N-acetyl-gamma-glutamyl-phosphate reductase [Roseburia sp.]MCM1463181.1 N-acetyl-gamma-glutamyl-phosphate reductase [Bacteroides sp.]
MATKVFIDGQEGTTGLKILERFRDRSDIELLRIDPTLRKNPSERKKMINLSDFTILCLPDAAAIEAVSFVENDHTRVIDASTAHRVNAEWAYGFPELSPRHREKIAASSRVAVPGCYASGFLSVVYPLVESGILPKDYPITSHAVSGYSGAGKKGIARYETSPRDKEFDTPRQYALTQAHKHLPEMQVRSGLRYKPMFNPYVCDYFAGMVVSVPLHTRLLSKPCTPSEIRSVYERHYGGAKFIHVTELNGADVLTGGFLGANALEGTNSMEIFVCGNEEQILVCSRLDNLGKGASGAAIQCLNIMMGIDETTGLVAKE